MNVMEMKKTGQDKIFNCFNYILATFFLLIAFYPLYFIVIASFSNGAAVAKGNVWIFPKGVTLEGYKTMLEKSEIWIGYRNTIIYTVIGTCINLVVTVSAAYVLSRKTLPFRRFLNIYFLIPMFLSGGLIPTYMLVNKLNLVNNPLILVLLGAVNIYNLIVCRTFFESSISTELIEAAKIDGSSELGIYWRIILPLSKSLLAVMTLFFAVSHWNSYYNALIYIRDKDKYPLQLVLRSLLLSTQLQSASLDGAALEEMLKVQSMKYGVIIVASVPVLLLYPFVQKHFVKGVMIGAVKG